MIVSDYFGIMMIMYYKYYISYMPWNNIAGHHIQMSSALIWQSGKPKILQRFSKIISKYQRVWWYIIFDDLGLYIQLELDKNIEGHIMGTSSMDVLGHPNMTSCKYSICMNKCVIITNHHGYLSSQSRDVLYHRELRITGLVYYCECVWSKHVFQNL